MTYKPNLSRMARLAAGSRQPSPGQDPLREEELRIELTEEFKPQSLVEKIWVEDIAYRIAAIEVIRAQIAGFKASALRSTYRELTDQQASAAHFALDWEGDDETGQSVMQAYAEIRSVELSRLADQDFMPAERTNWLDSASFAALLGGMKGEHLAHLRHLQVYEQEEVRERDRIINQFERRRRLAMRHAIEMVEARRRIASTEGAAQLADDGERDALAHLDHECGEDSCIADLTADADRDEACHGGEDADDSSLNKADNGSAV